MDQKSSSGATDQNSWHESRVDKLTEPRRAMIWGKYLLVAEKRTLTIMCPGPTECVTIAVLEERGNEIPFGIWEDHRKMILFYQERVVWVHKMMGKERERRCPYIVNDKMFLILNRDSTMGTCSLDTFCKDEDGVIRLMESEEVNHLQGNVILSSKAEVSVGSPITPPASQLEMRFVRGQKFPHFLWANNDDAHQEIMSQHSIPQIFSKRRRIILPRDKMPYNQKELLSRASAVSFGVFPDTFLTLLFDPSDDPLIVCTQWFLGSTSPCSVEAYPTSFSSENRPGRAESGDDFRRDLYRRALEVFRQKYLLPCGLGTRINPTHSDELFHPENQVLNTVDHILISSILHDSSGLCPFHLPVQLLGMMHTTACKLRVLVHFVRKYHPDTCDSIIKGMEYSDYSTPEEYLQHFLGWVEDRENAERFGLIRTHMVKQYSSSILPTVAVLLSESPMESKLV